MAGDYYTTRKQKEAQLKELRANEANRLLNLRLRMQEKLDGGWNVREVNDANYDPRLAPTLSDTTGRNPRARVIAYNSTNNTLIVVFWDNTWWQYNDVPVDMWMGISGSESTGGYLHSSGLNSWGDMGEADIDAIPAPVRAQIAQIAMSATRLRGTTIGV